MTSDHKLREDLFTKLAVPLWPDAGKALGLSRNSTYEAAKRGEIEIIEFGKLKKVTTSWLRKVLRMDDTTPPFSKAA